MPTNRGNHILVTDESVLNEQGEGRITGTRVGNKVAQDVKVLEAVNINVTLDLSDKISTFDLYSVNDISGDDPLFIGLSALDEKWLVKKFSDTSGTLLYANVSNNPTQTTYNDAWSNRFTLNFNKIHEITGV